GSGGRIRRDGCFTAARRRIPRACAGASHPANGNGGNRSDRGVAKPPWRLVIRGQSGRAQARSYKANQWEYRSCGGPVGSSENRRPATENQQPATENQQPATENQQPA